MNYVVYEHVHTQTMTMSVTVSEVYGLVSISLFNYSAAPNVS